MRPNIFNPAVTTSSDTLAINRVMRNTYFLLGLTLMFSALMAIFAVHTNANPGFLVLIVGMFGFYFLTISLRNSIWGIAAIFAYTGFMGYTLGPVLNMYLHEYVNGMALIATAFGTTGIIFLALSAYALTTRKDFSYLGGFLMVAILAAFLLSIAGMFFQMPILQLLISGLFAVLMSAFILYQTSALIHGGERNYIIATIGLYISIFNLFVSLLQILGAFAGNRR